MFVRIKNNYINTDAVSSITVNGTRITVNMNYPGTPGSSFPTEQYIVFNYETADEAEEAAKALAEAHNIK
jgi:hypothetical protein